MKRFLLVFGVLLSWGCNNEGPDVVTKGEDTGERQDLEGPIIEHDPVETAQLFGQAVSIEATVTDEMSSVFVVKVYYKRETSTTWDSSGMTSDGGDLFSGAIPADAVGSGGMHYYLYAVDSRQNESYLPEEGSGDPWHFRVYDE